jgi:anti-sigma factor RsiW
MTDCSNVEMRERLPELVHDALSAGDRAAVLAHVTSCTECAEELELLRNVQRTLGAMRVPAIDTAAIVAALPAAPRAAFPRPRVTPIARPARRSPTLFRLAAAISFISIGGISVAVARSYLGQATPSAVDTVRTDVASSSVGIPSQAANVTEPVAAVSADSRVLVVHPSIAALDDADLESLLGELDQLEAAPLAEPETTPGGRALAGAVLGSS